MGWNEPDKGKDPWSGKEQPPDLEEAFKRIHAKIKKAFGGSKLTTEPPTPTQSVSLLASVMLVIFFTIWALAGIFIVDPAEQAVILRFGKYSETVGPGPHWIPRFVDSKTVINMDRVSDYSYSAQMLTKDENLVSVSVAVQYRIGDLQDYLFNVTDPEGSLQQATSSALRQVVGNTTLDQIITAGREAWGINVQDSLVKILNAYKTGIIIVNVSPQPARAPENVQDAFDDAIKAQEDEKRFKEQAYAYKARVVPIAQGNAKRVLAEAKAYAQQIVLRAKGDIAGFNALLTQYMRAPDVTAERMYLDSMQKVLSNSTKVIVDSKTSNMLYLPLEKMQASASKKTDALRAQMMGAKIHDTSSDGNGASEPEGARQTNRLGRNE